MSPSARAKQHQPYALGLVLTLALTTLMGAGLLTTEPASASQAFGPVQVAGPHTATCPDGGTQTIQAAVDCALPGATVYVSPGSYGEAVVITTPDITLCSHIGGPLCALDIETAHWQTGSGTAWTDAPGGAEGQAILIQGSGSTSLFPAAGLRLSDVFALSFDVYLESGTCGAGTPRIAFGIDTTGDGARDGNVFTYPGQSVCTPNMWNHVDLMTAPDAYWASGAFGGPNHGSAADAQSAIDAAAAANGNTADIVAVNLQVDSGAPTLYVDNQRVNNWLFAERADEACFFDASQATCRHENAVRDTTITTQDGTAISIMADGVTVRGFSIRTGGLAESNGIYVGAASGPSYRDVRILDNVLRTPGLAESGITGRFDTGLIENNDVQGFRQGIYLRTHGKSVTVRDNTLSQNGEGILTYGFSPRIEGNTITGSLVRGIGIGNITSMPTGNVPVLHNNTISDQTPPLGFRDGVTGMHVDGRYNDWGTYTRAEIEASVENLGNNNTVDTRCYRAAGGIGYVCPPTAAGFETNADAGHWRRAVAFADDSAVGTSDIVRQFWSFGDGTTATGDKANHVYASSGIFQVTYTIEDADGYVLSASRTLTRTNAAPAIAPLADREVEPGERLVFTVAGADPDHDPVTVAASGLPTGAGLSGGNPAQKTFAWTPTAAQSGTHTLTFTATDGDKDAIRTMTVTVATAPVAHGVTMERTAPFALKASPGQVLRLGVVVRNDGAAIDTFTFTPTGADAWNVDVPAPVTLEPGEEVRVVFNTTVPDQLGSGAVGLVATSDAASWVSDTTKYLVRVPIQLQLVLAETPGLGGSVSGTVRATFLDGSPVAGQPVGIRHTPVLDGLGSSKTGVTDDNGTYAFSFPAPTAGLPGSHEIVADMNRHGQAATARATYSAGL